MIMRFYPCVFPDISVNLFHLLLPCDVFLQWSPSRAIYYFSFSEYISVDAQHND